MTRNEIWDFLQSLPAWFDEETIDEIAAAFTYPAPVYTASTTILLKNQSDTKRIIREAGQFFSQSGVTATDVQNLRVVHSSEMRAIIRFNIAYFDSDGTEVACSDVQAILCQCKSTGCLQFELLDWQNAGYPLLLRQIVDLVA